MYTRQFLANHHSKATFNFIPKLFLQFNLLFMLRTSGLNMEDIWIYIIIYIKYRIFKQISGSLDTSYKLGLLQVEMHPGILPRRESTEQTIKFRKLNPSTVHREMSPVSLRISGGAPETRARDNTTSREPTVDIQNLKKIMNRV